MSHPPSQSASPIILIVDDVEAMRYARGRTLSQAGYRIIDAANGEEALLLVSTLGPQLVILDVTLPGMNGLEVCKRIKSNPDSAHIMVLHVTSDKANLPYSSVGDDDGADGYLIEPIDPHELVATVKTLLRLSERQAENRRLVARLSRVERQFIEATRAANCGLWDWDIPSGKVQWLGETERLAGLRPGTFCGHIDKAFEVLHPDDREPVRKKLQDLMARREVRYQSEHRWIHPDGSVHWVSAVGRFFYDQQGQAVRMTGAVQDISARKQVEERQRLESERRRLLARAAEQLLVAENPDELMGDVFETVRQHLDLDGYLHYRMDEAESRLSLQGCAGVPDDRVSTIQQLQLGQAICGSAAKNKTAIVCERVHESHDEKLAVAKSLGFHACVSFPLAVEGHVLGTLSFASRVRDRFSPDEIEFMESICRYVAAALARLRHHADMHKRAELLRRSEEQLRIAVELNPQVPWTARPDGSIEEMNERWMSVCGASVRDGLDGWERVQHEEDRPRMLEAWTRAIRTGEPYEVEHRLRVASGDYRWMRSRAYPLRDGEGRIVRWYGTTEDIHERKSLEHSLQESLHQYRSLADTMPQIVFTVTSDGFVNYVNEPGLAYMGVSLDQACGTGWADSIHPEDRQKSIDHWISCMTSGEPYEMENRLRQADGQYRWQLARARPIRNEAGAVTQWIGTSTDIHGQKLAELSLYESRERFHGAVQFCEAVMANIKEGLYCLDNEGVVTYANRTAETLLGYSVRELLGKRMHETIHHTRRDGSPFPVEECPALQVLREGKTLIEQADVFIRKDGTFFDAMYSSSPMWSRHSIAGVVVIFRDVSEQRKAEQILRDSETRFRTMAQAVPSFLFETTAEGWNTWTSDGWCRFTGQSQSQVRGHGWADALHPDDRAANIGQWMDCMRDGVPFAARQRLRRADGSYAWVMARAIPMHDERGAIVRWLGSVTDIDDFVRGEEALRESEERFRQIAETTDYVFWVMQTNPERVLYVSPAFERLWQRTAGEIYDDPRLWMEVIHPDDQDRIQEVFERWLTDPNQEAFNEEYRIVRPDGTVRWMADRGHVIRNAQGEIYRLTGIARDITARHMWETAIRVSEERLQLAQSAATIGTFDWNIVSGHIYWSPEVERIWGLRLGEFGGDYDDWCRQVHPDDRPLAEAMTQRALTDPAAPYEMEYRIVRPDGAVRWLYAKASILRDESGRPLRMVGVNMDITDRKLAETKLAEQAHLQEFSARISRHLIEGYDLRDMLRRCTQTMVDDLGGAFARIWTLNEQDDVLELQASSGMYTNIDGRHSRIRVGSYKVGLIASERKPRLTNCVVGDPRIPDQEWARAEGMVAFAGYPLIVDDLVVGVMAMFSRHVLSDVTLQAMALVADHIALGIKRKRAEQALVANEQRMRFAMQAARMASCDWDVRTGQSLWSELHFTLLGYEPVPTGEATVEKWLSRVHPDDRDRVMAEIESAKRNHLLYCPEFRAIRADDGRMSWFSSVGQFFYDEQGEAVRSFGVFYDITDRKLAEQALRQERERLTLALHAGQMGVYDWNMVEDRIWWSPEVYPVFGVPADTFVPSRESFAALVHPDDRELFWRRLEQAITDRQLFVHEFRIVRPSGDVRWIANRAQTDYDDGRPVRHFGIASDITDLKEAEETLRRQEEQLRVITDGVPSFIAYVDDKERYQFVNAEYEKWLQRPRHEIIGLSAKELLKKLYGSVEPYIRRVLAGEPVNFEREIWCRGQQRTVLTSYRPDSLSDGTVVGFYVIATDISERKRQEAELHRWKDELEVRVEERTRDLSMSQERLRELAAQLSLTEQRERRRLATDLHDYLAQLLIVGRMKINQMKKLPGLPPSMVSASQDVDDILQQTLTYTRTLIAELCPPSLKEGGLPTAISWLAERMQKDGLWVEVHTNLEMVVMPDEQAAMLFQSVRELLFNVLKHAGVDRATVRLNMGDTGDVSVTVEDRGRGLSPDAMQRADEPGHLGLFSVRERMEAMGGRLDVVSVPGQGTRVTLTLPRMRR